MGGRALLDRVLAACADAARTVVVGGRRATARPVVWTREVPEGGADLHQLEARFDLFDEHVNLDGAALKAEVLFDRRKDVAPKRRFLGVVARLGGVLCGDL